MAIVKASTVFGSTTSSGSALFGATATPMKSRSLTITEADAASGGMVKRNNNRVPSHWNIHPGEILREEFLRPMGLSSYAAAKAIRVPAPRLNDIVLEKRGITADTAVRLARFFGTSEQFWMNLQALYDIRKAKVGLRHELKKIRPHAGAPASASSLS